MKKIIISFAFICVSLTAFSQDTEIRSTIDRFFQSMYKGDTAALRSCFIPAAQLFTFSHDADGNPRAKGETLDQLMKGIAGLNGESTMEEKLLSWQILIDDGIASVWTPYEFYFENKFSHCGVNSFQLMKVGPDWKITQITDTRRKKHCPDDQHTVTVIDSLIDQWHHAAATGDEEFFFGMMTEEGIYIGTDSTERWKRDELKDWSAKYFARESAWDFTPLSRNITVAPGGQMAWFDELLDTWMGTCRSTGILEKREEEWKIIYYHLSVAVPNDKMDEYRVLISKK
ncbi:MAG: nuclear transport factor 2 family protein [Saprospiraceae bacterium]